MAQIPNSIYPTSAGQFDGTTFRGSNLVSWDYIAENAIAQYQPVTTATVPGTLKMVSGSTARAGGPILGVALNAAVAGGTVNLLMKGIVPMFTSGSCTINAPVFISSSGSNWAIETYAQIGPVLALANNLSGSGKTIIGYAIATGSVSSGSNASYVGFALISVDV